MDWQKYEQQPTRVNYKNKWYQENKENVRIKNYRSKGLNFIKNHATEKDIREFRTALNEKERELKNE